MTATEQELLDLVAPDPLMIGPPPAERSILGQIECLRRLIVEIAHLLVKFKHGKSEFAVCDPRRPALATTCCHL